MKKSIIIIAAICIANFVFAQDVKNTPKNSIGMRIGTVTAFENHEDLENGVVNFITLPLSALSGNLQSYSTKVTPQIGLNYGLELSKKRTLNILFAYQKSSTYLGTTLYSEQNQLSIMGKMDLVWFDGKSADWYSGAGLGIGAYNKSVYSGYTANSDGSESRAIFHATALGFKTKGKVSIFGELGLGALGMLNGGMNVRF